MHRSSVELASVIAVRGIILFHHYSTRCASFALVGILAVTSIVSHPHAAAAAPAQQAQPEIPLAPPKPAWPDVEDRLRPGAGQFEGVPVDQTPLVLAPVPSPEAQANSIIPADLTFVVPPAAERARTGAKAFTFAGQVRGTQGANATPIRASATFVAQHEPEDSSTSAALSPVNVAFKLDFDTVAKRHVTQATQPLLFELDYGNVPILHGGDFDERLGLYVGSDCAVDASGVVTDCAALTRLPGINYAGAKRMVVGLDAAALALLSGEAKPDAPVAEGASAPATATLTNAVDLGNKTYLPLAVGSDVPAGRPTTGLVSGIVILSAGTDSPTGDYGAVPVGDVLDYQVGLNAGTAAINYPIPVPPPSAGPAPDVSLNYDSGSVDGTSLSRSAQPGSAGLGWAMKSGAIVRLMRTAPSGTGNLCYTVSGTDFVFSLNGMSSRLVQISGNDYVLRDDPRWKVQRLTAAAGHPDYEKLYWQVTSPDGTKYRFGGEFEPETSVDQDSVFWVPSFINATSSSCNVGSGGLQNRAWQWNLDRVEDTNGNVISYFYEQEQNYYKAWIYQSGTYQHKPTSAPAMSSALNTASASA